MQIKSEIKKIPSSMWAEVLNLFILKIFNWDASVEYLGRFLSPVLTLMTLEVGKSGNKGSLEPMKI